MRALAIGAALLLMVPSQRAAPDYRAEIEKYRSKRVAELTAPNGWLAVVGLFWLREGMNTAGSDRDKAIRLPARAPKTLGAFELKQGVVTLRRMQACGWPRAASP